MNEEKKVTTEDQVEAENVEAQEAVQPEVEVSEEQAKIEALEKELVEVKEQLKEQSDAVVRAQAFAQNEIRKAGIDAENRRKSVLKNFSNKLIPVADHLEMAIQHADKENETLKPIVDGVEMTLIELIKALGSLGVKQIDPMGEPLNPEKHQAMGMQVVEGVEPNHVTVVMQKGYELSGGQVVRPAMVMVSKAAE
ncbi:MAG: nucleotide exchange factor GrpE [Psychromonas sp.]